MILLKMFNFSKGIVVDESSLLEQKGEILQSN